VATIVFSAIGTALGGPLGGAIGALAGRQVDALVFRPPSRQGPRLSELALAASSYGALLPRVFGRVRTGGQVIWSTDLVEQRSRQGGVKGRPASVNYTYSASFAVALSSRPIADVGRIWADGKLLRGAAGDLKVGGQLRVHHGHGDQQADPLIAAAEGSSCPAHRGLAYVVFEDLQLADFGNRIPTLSFEVLADPAGFDLQTILAAVPLDCDAAVPLDGMDGMVVDCSPADLLDRLAPLYPLDCDACADPVSIRPERQQQGPLVLSDASTTAAPEGFGAQTGFTRTRALAPTVPYTLLRHFDPDRDYQPGVQRAPAQAGTGEVRAIELPATIAAPAARTLIGSAAHRDVWARHTLAWRSAELDPAVRPGVLLTWPGQPGSWRVSSWEWRAEGVELDLQRVAPPAAAPAGPTDPGRASPNPDYPPAPTKLIALELPWDGSPGTPLPRAVAAAAGSGPGWSGAALFVDQGDGALISAGSTGRSPDILGTSETPLAPGTPLLLDRAATVTVRLADPAASLTDATLRQLAQGANRALLGSELIQFATATPLGNGRWQLSGLLRGRYGTEDRIGSHGTDEPFVLLDSGLSPLEPALVGQADAATIAAIGLHDAQPAISPIHLAGIGWRPLSPVHGTCINRPDGSRSLSWVRRSRGGWIWDDGMDLPLNEQAEQYRVEFGLTAPIARWDCAAPVLELGAGEWAALIAAEPAGAFTVRQIGDRGISAPLAIRPV